MKTCLIVALCLFSSLSLSLSLSPQELMAYGVMNVVGCFFSSFPAAGSLSRSSVQANSGGKTQLVGFISSLILLLVLLWLGPLFQQLPRVSWIATYILTYLCRTLTYKLHIDTCMFLQIWIVATWLECEYPSNSCNKQPCITLCLWQYGVHYMY